MPIPPDVKNLSDIEAELWCEIDSREEGHCLRTSNLAFKPGIEEGYITASGGGGAWICRFKGLADGLPLFSHITGKE